MHYVFVGTSKRVYFCTGIIYYHIIILESHLRKTSQNDNYLHVMIHSVIKIKTLDRHERNLDFFSWENADIFVGSSHLKKKKKPQENLRPKHTRVRGRGSIPREFLDCLDAVCSGRLECKSQPRLISGRQRASGCAAEGNFLTITLRAFLLLAN